MSRRTVFRKGYRRKSSFYVTAIINHTESENSDEPEKAF